MEVEPRPVACCARILPLTTYYLLPTTYYLLPTTHYLLPSTFYLQLTGRVLREDRAAHVVLVDLG